MVRSWNKMTEPDDSRSSLLDRRRGALAAEHEVLAVAEQVRHPDRSGLQLENDPLAGFRIFHTVEQEIGFVQGFARKKHLRDVPLHPADAEDREMDMRRPPPPVGFAYRIGARLDRDEFVLAFATGDQPAPAGEVRIERRFVAVHVMDVLA